MSLYKIADRIEKRRKKLRKIKYELMNTKCQMSKSILECADADEMIKAMVSITSAISEIDEIIEQVL